MISAGGEVRIRVMIKFFQLVLGRKGKSDKRQRSLLVSIFKEKRDVRNCNTYRRIKLLEHAMKIVGTR